MKFVMPIMKVKNKMIKFSIIIPVYNVSKYLNNCLDSLVNQTYQNYEVIIVCDKCNDNSEEIVDNYVTKYANFNKIYAENTGLSKARNIGVNKASGEYILFLDGDDFYQSNCLEILNNNLESNLDLLRFQVQDVIDDKIIQHNETSFNSMNGINAFDIIIKYHYVENAWCYCYNTKFFKDNNFKFMENCFAEDYGLIPLIIAKAKKVKSIEYIGYNYVQRVNSLMNNNDYSKRIKKIDDMLKQSDYLKSKLFKINNTDRILNFVNNSLIYYTTTLKYKDYKKYKKILKFNNCFNHLNEKGLKKRIRNFFIKRFTYLFYNYLVR